MIQNNIDSNSNSNKEINDSSQYITVHLIISGKVQGVYFRKHTQDISLQNNVDKVIIWCHQGPPNSHVDNVEIKYEEFTGQFTDFKII